MYGVPPGGGLQGQTRDNSKLRFHTKKEHIYMCSYIISVVCICRFISCLKGFALFYHIPHTYVQIMNLNKEKALKVNYLSFYYHIILFITCHQVDDIYIYSCSAPTINRLTAHEFKGKVVRSTKFQQLFNHIFVSKSDENVFLVLPWNNCTD